MCPLPAGAWLFRGRLIVPPVLYFINTKAAETDEQPSLLPNGSAQHPQVSLTVATNVFLEFFLTLIHTDQLSLDDSGWMLLL